jgi:hypothetical protein
MRLTAQGKIERTAEMIADHIAEARNYAATLESICKCAAADKALLLDHSQFFATIKTALWGTLILHLHHCLDQRRQALGFHCLLTQIRAFIPEDRDLIRKIDESFQALRATKEAKAVGRWRSEMVAHVAHDHQSYGRFLQDVPCDFRNIDDLLTRCEHVLDECRRTFPDLRITRVLSFHKQAGPSVAEVMEALRMANKPSERTR